jgi:hypothetical protein
MSDQEPNVKSTPVQNADGGKSEAKGNSRDADKAANPTAEANKKAGEVPGQGSDGNNETKGGPPSKNAG